MNPWNAPRFPKKKRLPDAYAESIKNSLLKLAEVWTGAERPNCSDDPSNKMNRYKLFVEEGRIAGIFWRGTSNYIECDDSSFPREDVFWQYEKDTENKEINITIYFFDNADDAFEVSVSDTIGLFPEFTRENDFPFSTINEVEVYLEEIRQYFLE